MQLENSKNKNAKIDIQILKRFNQSYTDLHVAGNNFHLQWISRITVNANDGKMVLQNTQMYLTLQHVLFFFPIRAQLRFCWGFLRIHIQYSPLQGGFGGSNYLLLDLSRPIGTDPQRLLIQQFLFGQALTAFHRDQKRSIEEHGLLGILLYHLEAC